MPKNTGTLIGAVIKTADSADLYPVAEQSDIKGGHHTRATINSRDAMPAHLRVAGMTCYISATGDTYQLENDLVTWTLLKANTTTGGTSGTPLPGSGGNLPTVQLISGNFGVWTALGTPTDQIGDDQLTPKFKSDLQAFPTRAIVYLQGQFGLLSDFVGTTLTLGNIPANSRPAHQLKKWMVCKNIELFLIVETNGDVKITCKDEGFNLPVMAAEAETEDEPYYIECFYNPGDIEYVPPTEYTATRTGTFTRNNCGTGSTGTSVEFTYEYVSTVDQDTADAIADASFAEDGQAYANDPANGATCETGIESGSIFVNNAYSKPLYIAINAGAEGYINNFSDATYDEEGIYHLRMNFGTPDDVATYWLYDPDTYNPDDPDTYETGTFNNDGISVNISFGQVLNVQSFKPAMIS